MEESNNVVVERLTETIYGQLRQDILFGLYSAEQKMRLDALRSRYDVSVNTIREVLSRLASDGLVVAEGQRGFSLAPLTLADLKDITETRILLESQAVRLSLAVADLHWEGEVMAAHYRLARAEELANQDHARYRALLEQYDCDFHRTIIAGCRSPWILRFHATVYDHMLRYRSIAHKRVMPEQVSAMLLRSQRDHLILRDAALSKDAEQLIDLLQNHIRKGEQFARFFTDQSISCQSAP